MSISSLAEELAGMLNELLLAVLSEIEAAMRAMDAIQVADLASIEAKPRFAIGACARQDQRPPLRSSKQTCCHAVDEDIEVQRILLAERGIAMWASAGLCLTSRDWDVETKPPRAGLAHTFHVELHCILGNARPSH